MTPKLFYVHGYGFALDTSESGRVPLNLGGDGPLTDDKRTIVDAFNRLAAENARLRDALTEILAEVGTSTLSSKIASAALGDQP